jgi:hypothetical protein
MEICDFQLPRLACHPIGFRAFVVIKLVDGVLCYVLRLQGAEEVPSNIKGRFP